MSVSVHAGGQKSSPLEEPRNDQVGYFRISRGFPILQCQTGVAQMDQLLSSLH